MPRRYWDEHGDRGDDQRGYWREGEDIRSDPHDERDFGARPREYGGTRDMDFGSGYGGGRQRGGGTWDERGGGRGRLAGTRDDLGEMDEGWARERRWSRGGGEPGRERRPDPERWTGGGEWSARDRFGPGRDRWSGEDRDRWAREGRDRDRRWAGDEASRERDWSRDRAGSRGGGWFVPGRDDDERRHESGDFWERDIHGRLHDWSARPRGDRSNEERYRSAEPWFGADFGAQSWRGEWPSRDRDDGRRGAGRGPKGYKRSDERIREDVCERIARSPVRSDDVEVHVEGGEVTLQGEVDSRADKRRLEALAEDVFGVDDVHNQLRLRREERPDERRGDERRGDEERGDEERGGQERGDDGGLAH